MIQPPEGFEQSLRNYDPALSLRWGPRVKQWVIERQGRISGGKAAFLKFAAAQPGVDPKAVEEYESCKRGNIVVHYVKELDQRVHQWLWLNDLQRTGVNKPIKDLARSWEWKEQQRKKESHEVARQTNDILHHALNKRTVELDHGKADQIFRECLGVKQLTPRPQEAPKVAPILFDAFGKSTQPSRKPVKLLTATR